MMHITNPEATRGDSLAWLPRNLTEAATNTGSLILWGSSAYPRMDRADAVRMGMSSARTTAVLAVGNRKTMTVDHWCMNTGASRPASKYDRPALSLAL